MQIIFLKEIYYSQGEENHLLDSDGNIFLERDPKLYPRIFDWLQFGFDYEHQIGGSKFFLEYFKKEVQFLKLDSLGLLVQNYINKSGLYIITNQKMMLLDVLPKRDANVITYHNARKTLTQQIKNNNTGIKKDSDGNVFFDITEEEADLIISHKNLLVKQIAYKRHGNRIAISNGNYSIPITELARKLGIIKEDEAIYPPELFE